MPDPRRAKQITYPKQTLVWSAVTMFLLGLESRRQFRFESDSQAFVDNLNALADSQLDKAPHDDTVAGYLKRVPVDPFEHLPAAVVGRLIRMKVLDRWRMLGRFLIAIDGTGQLFFRRRHCPHCMTRTAADGTKQYFHPTLEAKLICESGLVFSVATEFIENTDPAATKQDCELKAFSRLATKLKQRFPQLPITILGDSLYACEPAFQLCRENRWHFIFVFKKGSIPSLFEEFQTLASLSPKNRKTYRPDAQTTQQLTWVNDLDYQNSKVSVFDCTETTSTDSHYFAWITDIPVGCASVLTLANQGGRLRWKIENQGFNIQKNHGYKLEHAYSKHPGAFKIFYFLLQLAHIINQLILNGNLINDFPKTFGSIRNFLRRFAEAFRSQRLPSSLWSPKTYPAFQIRLDSS